MDLEELVIGVKKANLSELKELKVKLPVRLLVNLHYVKLTQSRPISDVVNEALSQYFASMALPEAGRSEGAQSTQPIADDWLADSMRRSDIASDAVA